MLTRPDDRSIAPGALPLRWDLADLAVAVDRLAAAHDGHADDAKSWAVLCTLTGRLPEA